MEWKRYKKNPMPYCAWALEIRKPWGEWSIRRYRQPAIGQGPVAGGGKFQIIDSTWRAFGGGRYAAHAHHAQPLQQERVARRILKGQGVHAWSNC